jgi:hypothetical protein
MFRPNYTLQQTNSRNLFKVGITPVSLSQWCSAGQLSFCGSSLSWSSLLVTYSQHNLGLASVKDPSCKFSPFPVGNTTPDLYSDVHVGIPSVTISVFVFTIRCCFSFKALVVLIVRRLATCSCHGMRFRRLCLKHKSSVQEQNVSQLGFPLLLN